MKKIVFIILLLVFLCLVQKDKWRDKYDQIKLWILNRIILERGILSTNCPWYKISSFFLEDEAGIHLYNDYKEKYGDFALTKMFNEDIYIVTNVNYIKQILDNSPDIFSVGKLKKQIFSPFMDKNVGVSSGCPWKRRREMNEKVLLTDQLHIYFDKYNHDIYHFMLKKWKGKNTLKYNDFVSIGKYMTSRIIFNTNKMHDDVFNLFSEVNSINVFYPDFKINPSVLSNYNQYLDKHINNPNINSLVHLCVSTSSDKEEIKHQIPHFIFPIVGLYTISIPRILTLLFNDKVSLKKVIDEVKSVQNIKQIYKLSFLRKCILETLRLMNPLITTFRTLSQDYSFDSNHSFQKGTQFLILNNPVLREKEYFEKPNEFNPNRWTKEMEYSYYAISFNQGPQRCPAKELVISLSQSFIYNFFLINHIEKIKVKKINIFNVPQIMNPCEIIIQK